MKNKMSSYHKGKNIIFSAPSIIVIKLNTSFFWQEGFSIAIIQLFR